MGIRIANYPFNSVRVSFSGVSSLGGSVGVLNTIYAM